MDKRCIGANIREARKAASMTQEQLAEAVELSTGYISQLECNVKRARIDSLLRIVAALNVSLAQLFTDDSDEVFLVLFDDCTKEESQILYDMAQPLNLKSKLSTAYVGLDAACAEILAYSFYIVYDCAG